MRFSQLDSGENTGTKKSPRPEPGGCNLLNCCQSGKEDAPEGAEPCPMTLANHQDLRIWILRSRSDSAMTGALSPRCE